MGELRVKRFDEPDEVVSMPGVTGHIVVLGESYVGRYVHEPGWRWTKDIKPLVGTTACQYHHQGYAVSGRIVVRWPDGAERTIEPGDVFDIPPGHDAWVIGTEPFVSIEFRGARDWARPKTGERVLATLLFTDVVDSTRLATRLGDVHWNELLRRHYEAVRTELDRFRGYEIKTTGDGVLALFDGAARAVHCAAAICAVAQRDRIEVRAGVHSGEVQRYPDGVEGVAVHVANRIMSLAAPGEVLVSASTVALLEGSDVAFDDTGEHELKGVQGPRRLYRLRAIDRPVDEPAV